MVKQRKQACKSSAKVVGDHVSVKARCPIKLKKLTSAKSVRKAKKSVKSKGKRTEVPVSCKGLRKKARKDCVKKVCAQRPIEYRDACYKKAGVRK